VSHVLHHRVYKKKYNILRPKGGTTGGGGNVPGLFTLFDVQQPVVIPVPPVTLPDPPLASRNSFFSKVTPTGQETWEAYANLFPIGVGSGGVENITVNGITATISSNGPPGTIGTVRIDTGSGRYNTAPGPLVASGTKFWNFHTIADVIEATLAFSSPISYFGMYITDAADFNGAIEIRLQITGGGEEIYIPIAEPGANNGCLNFWGFIDGRWTGAPGTPTRTYDAVIIRQLNSASGDFFGFDGLTFGSFADVIYPPV